MSIITAGFEHGMRNAVERWAKRAATDMAREMGPEITRIVAMEMVRATARVAAEKAAKDQAQEREAFIKFMRSQGLPEEAIDAFIRQLPPQDGTAGA